MNEHEEGQVGEKVQQIQGWDVLQLPSDGCLLVQMDSPGLQLQKELLRTDEALLSNSCIFSLLLQEEQEQLLHEEF